MGILRKSSSCLNPNAKHENTEYRGFLKRRSCQDTHGLSNEQILWVIIFRITLLSLSLKVMPWRCEKHSLTVLLIHWISSPCYLCISKMWDVSLLLTLKLWCASSLYPSTTLGTAQHCTDLLLALLSRERQQPWAEQKGVQQSLARISSQSLISWANSAPLPV